MMAFYFLLVELKNTRKQTIIGHECSNAFVNGEQPENDKKNFKNIRERLNTYRPSIIIYGRY